MEWLEATPSGGGVPRGCVLLNAAAAALLTQLHYAVLVEIEMMLYCVSHVAFLYSFVGLRVLLPNAPRPFRLPGGVAAACAYSLPPFLTCAAVVYFNLLAAEKAAMFGGTVLLGMVLHALAALQPGRMRRRGEQREQALWRRWVAGPPLPPAAATPAYSTPNYGTAG